MYKDKTTDTSNLSKAEIISKNFTQLVMQNYTMQRSVDGMPSGLASHKRI